MVKRQKLWLLAEDSADGNPVLRMRDPRNMVMVEIKVSTLYLIARVDEMVRALCADLSELEGSVQQAAHGGSVSCL